jgi:hypothetical protein
MFFS